MQSLAICLTGSLVRICAAKPEHGTRCYVSEAPRVEGVDKVLGQRNFPDVLQRCDNVMKTDMIPDTVYSKK